MLEVIRKWWAFYVNSRLYRSHLPCKLAQFGDLPVIGGKDCEAVTRTPKHDETFKIGSGITVKALHTPCHTQDSICWFMEEGTEKVVFTGDTLFIGGWYTLEFGISLRATLIRGDQAVGNSSRVHQQRCMRR